MCHNTEDSQQFLKKVYEELDQKMVAEPYQINVLEETHILDDEDKRSRTRVSENAHTRILEKILKFSAPAPESRNVYPFLKSLLEYVADESGIKITDQIGEPHIESEYKCKETSGRIDLLVKESGKYAIIFENKINDAGEQNSQLARYIRQMEEEEFPDNKIFVFYLSSEGNDPAAQGWRYNKRDYYNDFQNRYFNLSYRYKVLPWLEKVEKDIPKDQPYLISAFNQYIDYLKGRFALRKIEDNHLKDILTGWLNLCDESALNSKIQRIDDKITSLSEFIGKLREDKEANQEDVRKLKTVTEVLRTIKIDILDKAVGKWPFEKFTGRKIYERDNYLGYKFSLNGGDYILYIGKYTRFFCSVISYPKKGTTITPENDHIFKAFFANGYKRHDWRASYYDNGNDRTPRDYEGAINKMREVLAKITSVNTKAVGR